MSDINKDDQKKTIPFYPDHFNTEARVAWFIVGLAVIVGIAAIIYPVGLEDRADPMLTPDHVKPEWYFLGLYQLLKFIPKTTGVLLPIVGLIVLLTWPLFDKKPDSRKQQYIRMYGSLLFMVVLIALTIWGWIS